MHTVVWLQLLQILKIYISQGSVVMGIRCGEIFNDYYRFTTELSVKEF